MWLWQRWKRREGNILWVSWLYAHKLGEQKMCLLHKVVWNSNGPGVGKFRIPDPLNKYLGWKRITNVVEGSRHVWK